MPVYRVLSTHQALAQGAWEQEQEPGWRARLSRQVASESSAPPPIGILDLIISSYHYELEPRAAYIVIKLCTGTEIFPCLFPLNAHMLSQLPQISNFSVKFSPCTFFFTYKKLYYYFIYKV